MNVNVISSCMRHQGRKEAQVVQIKLCFQVKVMFSTKSRKSLHLQINCDLLLCNAGVNKKLKNDSLPVVAVVYLLYCLSAHFIIWITSCHQQDTI